MLNLSVAMFSIPGPPLFLLSISLIGLWSLLFTPTPLGQELVINSPAGGESLQGMVTVIGTTRANNFVSLEVSFAYQSDPTRTWFLIGQRSGAVEQEEMTSWDTSTITDGTYRLRVQMFLADGSVKETIVEGLRVRNYSPVETSTPQAATSEAVVVVRATPTATFTPLPDFVIPTRLPAPQATNPVQVGARDLVESAGRGFLVVVGALGLSGIYLALKAVFRR
jgi:hypothetical protein